MRLAPVNCLNEATTTLLMPSVRSLGPLTMGTGTKGLFLVRFPLGQSLLILATVDRVDCGKTAICFCFILISCLRGEKYDPDN